MTLLGTARNRKPYENPHGTTRTISVNTTRAKNEDRLSKACAKSRPTVKDKINTTDTYIEHEGDRAPPPITRNTPRFLFPPPSSKTPQFQKAAPLLAEAFRTSARPLSTTQNSVPAPLSPLPRRRHHPWTSPRAPGPDRPRPPPLSPRKAPPHSFPQPPKKPLSPS